MTRIENLKKVIEVVKEHAPEVGLEDVIHTLQTLEKAEEKKEEKRKIRVELFNQITEILKGKADGMTADDILSKIDPTGEKEITVGKIRYVLREGAQAGFIMRGANEDKKTTYKLI